MRVVIQRASEASVSIDGNTVGRIGRGYVCLVGFGAGDDEAKVERAVEKIRKLRIFQDDNGKTNLSIGEVGGGLLVVSQFTLYADCRKGTRPSFTEAAPPALAQALYEYFVDKAGQHFTKVACGRFGAAMQVELVNDGPFTVVLESDT